jgi:hypothetical protein
VLLDQALEHVLVKLTTVAGYLLRADAGLGSFTDLQASAVTTNECDFILALPA